MIFRFFWVLFLCPFLSFSQTDTVTCCRFYPYNDESLFKKINEKTNEITFFIDHSENDSLDIRLRNLLSMKKGLYNFNINNINQTELSVILSTSNLFDAHYLRVILEHQMKIENVKINDNSLKWDEFEKIFLTVSN